jgi:hypothetical protein
MGMFGNKEDDKQYKLEQWQHAMRQEIARLDALPLADVAAEVMIRGFGPGGPGADDDAISVGRDRVNAGPTAADISLLIVADRGFTFPIPTAGELKLRQQLTRLVAEGLQQLEHASLVRCQMHSEMGIFDWAATRYGRAALQRGDVQAILHGTAR